MAGIVSLPTLGGGQAWAKTPIPAPWMVLSWSTMWLSFLHSDGSGDFCLQVMLVLGLFLGELATLAGKMSYIP